MSSLCGFGHCYLYFPQHFWKMFILVYIEVSICPSAPTGAPIYFSGTLNNTVLSLMWEPVNEAEQNGEILFYTLTCNVGSDLAFELNLIATVEEIELGVYEADATYTCEIYASYSAGNGPSATITVTTGGR